MNLIIEKADELPLKLRRPRPFVNKKGVIKIGGGLLIDYDTDSHIAIMAKIDPDNNNQIIFGPVGKHNGNYYLVKCSNEKGESVAELPQAMIKTYLLTEETLANICWMMVRSLRMHALSFKFV